MQDDEFKISCCKDNSYTYTYKEESDEIEENENNIIEEKDESSV